MFEAFRADFACEWTRCAVRDEMISHVLKSLESSLTTFEGAGNVGLVAVCCFVSFHVRLLDEASVAISTS